MPEDEDIATPVVSLATPEQQELNALLAEMRNDFLFYIKACDPAYIASKIHVFLAKKLQDVAEGRCKRLIISIPPRCGKSRCVATEYPTWLLGRNPKENVVLASYSQELVNDRSREARARIRDSEVYRAAFPKTIVNDSDARVNNWGTTEGGRFQAVSVGAGLTGRNCSCFPPGTMITTEIGDVAIEALANLPKGVRVLAYDVAGKQLCYKGIQALSHREADGLYRVTTTSGRVVEATGEHPFFTGSGYTEASKLATGDYLLSVLRDELDQTGFRCKQIYHTTEKAGILLQSKVLDEPHRRWPQMQAGLRSFSSSPSANVSSVQGKMEKRARLGCDNHQARTYSTEGKDLSAVQRILLAASQWFKILRGGLRKRSTQREDGGQGESRIQARPSCTQKRARAGWIQAFKERYFGEGWWGVCNLRQNNGTGGSSHRHESTEQSVVKPDNDVYASPHEMARRGAFKAEGDSVALVECLREPSVVWNLQVEGTQNYFANGILVHNCLILDDLVKDFEEAHSELVQERIFNWLQSVAMTRLFPGSPVIFIMTRWSTSDPVARILDPEFQARLKDAGIEDSDKWDVVNIPAVCEDPEADLLGRAEGESIFPERFSEKELAKIKAERGSFVWASLYCGRPVALGGNYIKVDQIKTVSRDAVPKDLHLFRYWDLAATEKKTSDYTVGILGGIDHSVGVLYIIDMIRGRWEWPYARDMIKRAAIQDKARVGVEAVAGFKTAFSNLIEVLPSHISCSEFGADKDKMTRALPWMAMVENGKVCMVQADWNIDLLLELGAWPRGKHDDIVDGISGMAQMARNNVQYIMPSNSLGRRFGQSDRGNRSLIG